MIRRTLVPIVLLAATLPAPARPASPAPGDSTAVTFPRDTARAGSLARHGWAEAGIGWIGAPAEARARFEAGQGFAAGLEARPRTWLRLRAGADLQTLTANATARYEAVSQDIGEGTDSLTFTVQSRAWWLSLRGEAGLRGPGGVWLWAGGGGGWFDGGADRSVARSADLVLRVTEAAPDRWVWSASLGVARSLQPFLPWPIGIDVRSRWLLRKTDAFDPWTIRIVWMRR